MIRYGRLKIRRERVPSLDQVEEARENQFFERLRATLDEGKFFKHDRMLDRLLDQGYASTDIASALIHMLQGQQAPGTSGAPAGAASHAASAKGKGREPSGAPSARPTPPAEVQAEIPDEPSRPSRKAKPAFERPGRTGSEPGFTTLFFSVGRKNLITPADLVGKIAGVTRQPASIVGAIDIHQRHSLVDIANDCAALVCAKLSGVRVKGQALRVLLARDAGAEANAD
jgi:ATP-dependent RNA helicase DeaD